MIDKPTTLDAILKAKEGRALKQKELLARFPLASLISLTINIPSLIKLSHEAVVIHEIAYQSILSLLREEGIELLLCESKIAPTGVESLFVCSADAKMLKVLTCSLEQAHPLGRLMDIDVLDFSSSIFSRDQLGLSKRQCFVCNDTAHLCARAQKHSYTELNLHIKRLVEKHAFANSIALWCERAMQKEVELTPKPGLVDRSNSGAHQDMDIYTFYASIKAIKSFIPRLIQTAHMYAHEEAKICFKRLREIGIDCEQAMFEVTKGVNTHKGMIFCLAILCGAIGRIHGNHENLTYQNVHVHMKALCHNLVEDDLVHAKPNSAGARFFYESGSTGIRGIAQSGFAIIFEKSLPYYKACEQEEGEEIALKKTLLLLISELDDSTLWSRGGMEGLSYAKAQARERLHRINEMEMLDACLNDFDRAMIEKNLSPGGSADLLAMTWLLAQIVNS